MRKAFLEAGEFVTTHGVTGELKLYPWSDDALFIKGFKKIYMDKDGKKSFLVQSTRAHKSMCLVKLEGIASIEDARAFIGKTVYISRKDVKLPKGRYFIQDLIGSHVENALTGEVYGKITAISRPGRHDVYEIKDENGKVWLFPAAEPFIDSINIEAGVIKIKPIEGMFSDTD